MDANKVPPDPRIDILEGIFREARAETVFGVPVMEVPRERVSSTQDGRIFVDLRAVIDQLELFVMAQTA